MNVKLLIKTSEQFLSDRSPVILTGVAVAGTITTAYLAVLGSRKATQKVNEENISRYRLSDDWDEAVLVSPKEEAKMTWQYYLPAAGATALTISCIVCANHISAKRIAAMAAAYSLGESKFEEYKDKVAEKFGREAHDQVKDEIIQDKVSHGPGSTIILGDGEQLCFDAYSGRYFRSTYNAIEKAANQINQLVVKENYQTLDDFWDLIGLEATAYGVEQGFNVDNMLEIEFGTMMSSDSKPCLVIKYDAVPIRGWNH